MGKRAKPIRSICAQHARMCRMIKNINIDIDFIEYLCHKMNSSSLMAKTLGIERNVARSLLGLGRRHSR